MNLHCGTEYQSAPCAERTKSASDPLSALSGVNLGRVSKRTGVAAPVDDREPKGAMPVVDHDWIALRWMNSPSCNFILRGGLGNSGLLARTPGLRLSFVEFSASAPDLLGRETFDVAVIELPVGARSPGERQLHGSPRRRCGLENAQSKIECEGLRYGIVWPPRGVAEREIGEQKPRHTDILDDILRATHDNGGDAVLLQHSRGQADGLVADGAIGNQDRCIDFVRPTTRDDLRTVDLERHTMAAIGRSTMKARCNRPDAARSRPLTQLGQRKIGSRVLGRRVLAIDGDVRNAQVGVLRRVARIDSVE